MRRTITAKAAREKIRRRYEHAGERLHLILSAAEVPDSWADEEVVANARRFLLAATAAEMAAREMERLGFDSQVVVEKAEEAGRAAS